MLKKPLIKVTWGKAEKFLEKAALAKDVGNKIKSQSSVFPNPDFRPDDLIRAGEVLDTTFQTRLNGPVAKSEFHDADHAADVLLYAAAHYVNALPNLSETIINQSGFSPVSAVRVPAHVPAQPTLKVDAMGGGLLDLSAGKVDGYDSYGYIVAWGTPLPQIAIINHQLKISGSTDFVIIPAGHIHERIGNIAPAGTQVTSWCFAQNSAGIGPLSNPVGEIFLQK